MVDRKVSLRVIDHLPSGPILDKLSKEVGMSGYTFSYPAKGEPATSVLFDVLKKASVTTAKEIAERTSNPEVLSRLAAKDKRKGVLLALGANKNLPSEAALSLARKALAGYDRELLKTILEMGDKKIAYFVAKTLVDEGLDLKYQTGYFINAAAARGTNESFDFARKLIDKDDRASMNTLFERSCFRGSRVSTQRLLDLYQEKLTTYGTVRTMSTVAKSGGASELVRRCLQGSDEFRSRLLAFDSEAIVSRLMELSLGDNPPISTLDVVKTLDQKWERSLNGFLEVRQVEITPELLQELLRIFPPSIFRRESPLNWTTEAIEMLLSQTIVPHPSFVGKVTDPEKLLTILGRGELLVERALTYVKFEQLEAMLELGLDQDQVLGLIHLKLVQEGFKAAALSKKCLKVYLQNAITYPRSLETQNINDEELDIIIKRELETPGIVTANTEIFVDVINQAWRPSRAFKRKNIFRILTLQPFLVLNWVNAIGKIQPRVGEFTYYYNSLSKKGQEKVVSTLVPRGATLEDSDYLEEALDLLPGLVTKSAPGITRLVVERFTLEFGESVILWETALTLLPTWTGTLRELTEAAKTL